MHDLPGRLELHAVPTLTMPDTQFLRGEAAGAAATTLGGLFSLAQGGGRQPCVVMMHGSGGIAPSIPLWMREFNAAGAACFALDGFTGRGLISVSGDQAKLGRLAFILDIYRALALLVRHPAVDPARLVVMGFSRGGQAALYSGMARFHCLWNPAGVLPLATLALYPDCSTRYRDDTAMAPGRLAVFHGTEDDFNPIALARAHAARLRAAGHPVSFFEYPGAHHGFDSPIPSVVLSPDAQSMRYCRVEEREDGILVNAANGAPFSYADPCVAAGAHVGGDAVAGPQVRRDVLGFLRDAGAIEAD